MTLIEEMLEDDGSIKRCACGQINTRHCAIHGDELLGAEWWVYDPATNNILAEFGTRAEADAALADWPGCEVVIVT